MPDRKTDATSKGRGLSARERLVLTALSDRPRPVTAQELHAELRSTPDRVGLSTVYRILHALAGWGLLHEFPLSGAETGYRSCGTATHGHVICQQCGLVQEVAQTKVHSAIRRISLDGFTVTGHRLELLGICHACSGTASEPTREQGGPVL